MKLSKKKKKELREFMFGSNFRKSTIYTWVLMFILLLIISITAFVGIVSYNIFENAQFININQIILFSAMVYLEFTAIYFLFNVFGIIFDVDKLRNFFIYLGMFMFIIIIVVGFSAVFAIYKPVYPLTEGYRTIQNPFSEANMTYSLTCYSLPRSCDRNTCNVPVEGTHMSCVVHVDGIKENITYSEVNAELTVYPNFRQNTTNKKVFGKLNQKDNKLWISDIRIPVGPEGFNEFNLDVSLQSNESSEMHTFGTYYILYTSITNVDYYRRQNEEIAVLFGILSLAFIAAFSGTKNLMEIWDRDDSRSERKNNTNNKKNARKRR